MRSDELLNILLPAGKDIDELLALMPEGAVISVAADGQEFVYSGHSLLGGVDGGWIGKRLIVTMARMVGRVDADVIVLLNNLSEILTEEGDGEVGTRSGVTHFTAERDSSKVSFTEAAYTVASILGVGGLEVNE